MRDIAENFSSFVAHQRIYVSEAHAIDEWAMFRDVDYFQPKSLQERISITRKLSSEDQANLMIDNMNNDAEKNYSAHPERLYVVDQSKKIIYKGGMGPFEYKPQELKEFLSEQLAGFRKQ